MREKLLGVFEGVVVRLVLHLLKISGGFPAYLISNLIEYGFDKFIFPLVNKLIDDGLLNQDIEKGKIQLKRLKDIEEGNSNEVYDDVVDDIIV